MNVFVFAQTDGEAVCKHVIGHIFDFDPLEMRTVAHNARGPYARARPYEHELN